MPLRFEPEKLKRYAPFIPGIPQPEQDYDECPKIGFCVNETWIPLIIGALQTLTWKDLYAGDTDRAEDIARQANNLIIEIAHGNIECGCDMPYLLRQKPNSPCVLEQSTDNGLTWSTAFDFSLCQPTQSAPSTYEVEIGKINFGTIMNETNNIYDGTPGSVASDCVMDGGDNDAVRNQAMCYAVNMLIATIATQYKEKIERGWDWQDYAKLAAGTVAVVSGVAILAAPIAGIALGAQVATGLAITEAVSLYVYESIDMYIPADEFGQILESERQRLLVCAAMEVLRDTTPDILTFATIFDGVDPAAFDDNTLELLQHIVEQESIYLHFLNLVQAGYDAIQGGQRFTCPCEKYIWTFDFTAESGDELNTTYGQHLWDVVSGNAGRGRYESGTGWVFDDESTGDHVNARGVSLFLAGIYGNVDSVKLIMDIDLGITDNINHHFGSIIYGGDGMAWKMGEMPQGVDRSIERQHNAEINGDWFEIAAASDVRYGDDPPFEGSGILKKIVITGYGDVPTVFKP